MIVLLVVVVVVGTAMWVYLDATKHKIGKFPTDPGFWNMSAGDWATNTVMFWIIVFPVYVLKRPELIEKAKQEPMETRNPALGVVLLSGSGAILGVLGFVLFGSNSPPSCDSPQIVELAEQAIRDSPLVKLSGVELMGVTSGGQVAHDYFDEKRTCRAILETELGRQAIKYTVEWSDRDRRAIWLEIVR